MNSRSLWLETSKTRRHRRVPFWSCIMAKGKNLNPADALSEWFMYINKTRLIIQRKGAAQEGTEEEQSRKAEE